MNAEAMDVTLLPKSGSSRETIEPQSVWVCEECGRRERIHPMGCPECGSSDFRLVVGFSDDLTRRPVSTRGVLSRREKSDVAVMDRTTGPSDRERITVSANVFSFTPGRSDGVDVPYPEEDRSGKPRISAPWSSRPSTRFRTPPPARRPRKSLVSTRPRVGRRSRQKR